MNKKILATIIFFFASMLLPGWVVFNNIYPSFSFNLNQVNEFGRGFTTKTNDGKSFLVVAMEEQYPFNGAKLKINLDESSLAQLSKNIKIALAKDYWSNTYPIGGKITSEDELKELLYQDNPAEVPNGALYSYGEAVFAVSRGKYYPIISPTVFESMGYAWENVSEIKNQDYSQLTVAEKINFMSAHPDGTIFKTKDGQYFMIWEGKKRPIESYDLLANVWSTFYWVNVDKAEPEFLRSCETSEVDDTIKCDFSFKEFTINELGDDFIFSFEPADVTAHITGAKVKMGTSFSLNKNYLKYSLGQIKNKLYMRYAGYFLQ